MISFNKPYLTGREAKYMCDAANTRELSGNGKYTRLCHNFFENKYSFGKCLLTTSCTDALEMAALLLDIKPEDEVILPSYTFVSTANAFVLRGAKLVFVDSREDHPGMDEEKIEDLITEKTKAIVPVHYAGVSCDMDKIMTLAKKYNLFVVEDAAQAIDSYYTGKDGIKKALGSIGHLAAFSFHESKNIISGEGGMLAINDPQFKERAEILWEKGTNRSAFFRGEVDKYEWIDLGSSFLPSEIIAAFLWAQLENLEDIQKKRLNHWNLYDSYLNDWAGRGNFCLPEMPGYATNNAHIFYLVCETGKKRDFLIKKLKKSNIEAVFHYLSLHNSHFYKDRHGKRILPHCERYAQTVIRLPLYYELREEQIKSVSALIYE